MEIKIGDKVKLHSSFTRYIFSTDELTIKYYYRYKPINTSLVKVDSITGTISTVVTRLCKYQEVYLLDEWKVRGIVKTWDSELTYIIANKDNHMLRVSSESINKI